MPRRPSGQIIERTTADGRTTRSLRFRAYGKRHSLALGEVSEREAARRLRGLLADVERGIWRPEQPPTAPDAEPTFHEFAAQWWIEREREWAPRTRDDYRWRLERHLLPFFAEYPLRSITIAEVDRYRATKLAEGRLGPRAINMTLTLLAAVLAAAEERELIDRNPAAGKRRRVKGRAPRRSYLDTADQIATLLDAARALDTDAPPAGRHVRRHALLATLTFAGLRLGELLALRWGDVDLAAGRLRVGDSKTDAGRRHVTIRPALRDTLAELAANGRPPADAHVFATSTGAPMSPSNVRNRVLAPAIRQANRQLERRDLAPLPVGITPHSLRRTFASLLYALGEPPPVVMAEMGHTSPTLALAVYAQTMSRDEGATERLRALVEGAQLDAPAPRPAVSDPKRF